MLPPSFYLLRMQFFGQGHFQVCWEFFRFLGCYYNIHNKNPSGTEVLYSITGISQNKLHFQILHLSSVMLMYLPKHTCSLIGNDKGTAINNTFALIIHTFSLENQSLSNSTISFSSSIECF